MLNQQTTATADDLAGRSVFGSLHYHAVKGCEATPHENAQRKDFLDGKPNVWGTLDRHLDALISAGTSEQNYDLVIETFAQAARDKFQRRKNAVPDVQTAYEMQEAAEGFEDIQQVTTLMDADDPHKLRALYERTHALWIATGIAMRSVGTKLRRVSLRPAR